METPGGSTRREADPGLPLLREGSPFPPRIRTGGPAPKAGRAFPLGPGGTQRIPPALPQVPLGREQMAAQTEGGSRTRVLGPGGRGLTFGKRRRRSGQGCWGRSCGGCPGGCCLCRERGGSLGWAGGQPHQASRSPQRGAGSSYSLFTLVPNGAGRAPLPWPRLRRRFGYGVVSTAPSGRHCLPSSATATPRRYGSSLLPHPLTIQLRTPIAAPSRLGPPP